MRRFVHRPAAASLVAAVALMLLLPTFLWGQSDSGEFRDLTLLFNGAVQGKIAPCG